ncbi:TlpA family protein disulfide reductase [Psychroserpens jangbogonensis]|uniref:TlpA family protein disulfide reductase n=1 Tax=Psychroserpens jangbogonensis TaxID=1484460 RepID=UPI00053D9342|nr:TlpA disulfide reductase family protein [Psychroserpens jangbogonensis]
MKSITYFLICSLLFVSCSKEIRTQFSEDVLNEQYVSLKGDSVAFKDILSAHKGKQIVIDVWASWCRDCIVGLPELEALQAEKPNAVYLFLSADRDLDTWKRTIKKYNIEGEHYFMTKGTKGLLGEFVDIDWIPRYMIVDSDGHIELFDAIEADDPLIRQTLK